MLAMGCGGELAGKDGGRGWDRRETGTSYVYEMIVSLTHQAYNWWHYQLIAVFIIHYLTHAYRLCQLIHGLMPI